jgi:outer membrane protein
MMQRTIFTAFRLAPVALLLAASLGSARADDDAAPANTVRLGAYIINYATTANDLSGPFTPPGINLRVGNVTTPYFAYLRSLDAHWVVEFAAGVPPTTHTYGKGPATVGSVPFNGQEVATAKWFSPSVLLEYKFLDPSSALRPLVGAGINYTRFYKINSTPAGDAANGGPTRISLSSSWGPAATIGAVYRITRAIDVTASYSLARVNSNYQSDTSGIVRETRVHFNPRTWVLAVGYSF